MKKKLLNKINNNNTNVKLVLSQYRSPGKKKNIQRYEYVTSLLQTTLSCIILRTKNKQTNKKGQMVNHFNCGFERGL